jgi:hypothetical protein
MPRTSWILLSECFERRTMDKIYRNWSIIQSKLNSRPSVVLDTKVRNFQVRPSCKETSKTSTTTQGTSPIT